MSNHFGPLTEMYKYKNIKNSIKISIMGKFLYLQNEKVVRCHLDVNTV